MSEIQAGELPGSSQTPADNSADMPKPRWGDPGAHIEAARQHSKSTPIPPREQRPPWVAFACYAVAVVSLPVSLNTSWRFFDRVLHIPTVSGERYVMFAVAELALIVCGAGMAINVQRNGRPGSFRTIVWAMCSAMAYMAWAESAPEEAIGRILLGPVLGTIMLHLGLGLELRTRHHHTGTTARIGRELRERCLAWMGLSDDERDAAQRTRDRKAYRAAALSRPRRWPWSRQTRLERALLAAGVADDPMMRERLLSRLAVVRHANALATLTPPSPWAAGHGSSAHSPTGAGPRPPQAAPPGTTGGDSGSADMINPRPEPNPDAADTPAHGSNIKTISRFHRTDDTDDGVSDAAAFAGIDSADHDGWVDVAQTLIREKVTVKPVEQTAQVLRLWDQRVPTTTIATRTGVHRDTVTNIVRAAESLMATADRMRA